MSSWTESYPTPSPVRPISFKTVWPKRLWPWNLSGSGVCLFILCLLVTASAVRVLRIELGGLLVHPYLVFLLPLFLLTAPPRITRFPQRALVALVAFEFFYILSIAVGLGSSDEVLKIGAAGVTIVATALLVRTKADFRAGVLALSLASTVISMHNLLTGGELFGMDREISKSIGTKNAFSLYVLPPLLMAMTVLLDRTTAKTLRIVLAACTVIMTVAIFSSGNRSGWLGALCIGVMMYGRRRGFRSTLLISVIVLFAYYGTTRYTDRREAQMRLNQTAQGYSGDMIRWDIVSTSLSVGLQNPLLGVSPSGLSRELGRRLPSEAVAIHSLRSVKMLGSHNAVLQIIGGSGIFAFGSFMYLAWQLWKRPRLVHSFRRFAISQMDGGHTLLRMMMVLWLVRGMFTEEVLYSPGFCIALGLCIGLCIIEKFWQPRINQMRNDYWTIARAGHCNPIFSK